MAARKKKHEEEEHENHERWLVTYADMITLLMVLFIVLFSMATVDANKFSALKDSLAGVKSPSEHVLQGNPSVIDGGAPQTIDSSATSPEASLKSASTLNSAAQSARNKAQQQDQDNLKHAQEQIQSALNAQNLGDQVQFQRTPKGLVVSIVSDRVLFDTGKADVRNDGQRILDVVTPPLKDLPNDITIEGHTDDVAISSPQFPSNWELSTTRATSVLRYMTDRDGMPAARLSASGYADQRPVVANDSPEHRSQNRRVEIVVQALNVDSGPVTNSATVGPESLPSAPTKPVLTTPTVPQLTSKQE